MRSLREFQEHYGITDTEKAKAEYQRYLEALELFKRIEKERVDRPENVEEEPGANLYGEP